MHTDDTFLLSLLLLPFGKGGGMNTLALPPLFSALLLHSVYLMGFFYIKGFNYIHY